MHKNDKNTHNILTKLWKMTQTIKNNKRSLANPEYKGSYWDLK